MMSNLFSIFDSSTSLMWDLNWISSITSFIILPYSYYLLNSNLMLLMLKLNYMLINEFKIILSNKFNKFNLILIISLFMYIMLNNLMGLMSYIFTSSSHLVFSLSISLPTWICLMFMSFTLNTLHILSHTIPLGTPLYLMPFMVIIETISNLIRPATLAIRLTANMIAGHLLITLLSQTATNFMNIPIIINIQIILLLLEISVAMIQAYVFAILMTLYISETN